MSRATLPLDRPPQRVALIGCCGAGKSTLAARLAPALDLPLVHLDAEYWRPNWVETPRAEWVERHAQLIAPERWLIDGNYGGTMRQRVERADLVVLIVVPSRVALWRVVARTFRGRGRTRIDMAAGCVENPLRRGTLAFWHYTARFNRDKLPGIRRLLDELAPERTIVIASEADADRLVASAAKVR